MFSPIGVISFSAEGKRKLRENHQGCSLKEKSKEAIGRRQIFLMRILGIDLGEKRIGLAIANLSSNIAQPLKVLPRKNMESDIKKLKEIVEEYDVREIVVGLPLNMDGREGKKAKEAISFSELLKEKLKLPVELWDERLSTIQGERVLLQADVSRAKRKKVRDKLAAQLILQSYLDARQL